MRFLRYWKDPAYWSWRWQRVSIGTKLLLGLGLAVMCGLGGYTAAKGLADADRDDGSVRAAHTAGRHRPADSRAPSGR